MDPMALKAIGVFLVLVGGVTVGRWLEDSEFPVCGAIALLAGVLITMTS